MRFDWYGASVMALPEQVEAAVLAQFGGSFMGEAAKHSFAYAQRHEPTRARMMWGGRNPLPFLEGSGDDAPRVVELLRSEFPGHRVARADVALDYDERGAFDRLVSIVSPIADQAKVGRTFIESDTGRTLYRGARSSDVQIRIYEKGRKELGAGRAGVSEDWCRLELQVRPRKERKALCGSLSEAQMFGVARWSRDVLEAVSRELVPFVPDPSLRKSDDDRALDHMCRQYGAVMGRRIAAVGSQGLMRELLARLRDQKEGR